jgi:hypothetical protein
MSNTNESHSDPDRRFIDGIRAGRGRQRKHRQHGCTVKKTRSIIIDQELERSSCHRRIREVGSKLIVTRGEIQLLKEQSETVQQLGDNLKRLPSLNEVLRGRVIPRPLADARDWDGLDKKRGIHPLSQPRMIEVQEQTHDR